MIEEEARDAVARIVGASDLETLDRLVALILAENARQNLISRATVAEVWSRHVLDSVQLLSWSGPGHWLDIGTGGGFPGLAIAAVRAAPILLIEPRAKRAAFLRDAAATLELDHVAVAQANVQAVVMPQPAAVITARAVAKPAELVEWAFDAASRDTRWLLQRGASWQVQLADLQAAWKGSFHVEHSLTNPEGRIIVASGLERR